MTTKSDRQKLTPKQERFIEEYLIDLNATQAAIRAGYSSKTAEQQGYQLLQKTTVRNAINERREESSARVKITQDMVIDGLLREARYDGDGASHGARVSAWEKLAKHLGMLTERVKHEGLDGLDGQDRDTLRALERALAETAGGSAGAGEGEAGGKPTGGLSTVH